MSTEKEYFKLTPEMFLPIEVFLASSVFKWENLPEGVTQDDMDYMLLTKGPVATMNWLQEKFRQQNKDKTDS